MRFLLSFIFLLILGFQVKGQVIEFQGNEGVISIGKYVSGFEDTTGSMTIDQVKLSDGFKGFASEVPALGVSDNPRWLKFKVKVNDRPRKLVLELENVDLISLDLFVINDSTGEIVSEKHYDQSVKFEDRSFQYVFPVIQFRLPRTNEATVYVKLKSKWPLVVPIRLGRSNEVMSAYSRYDFLMGGYFGILGIMFLLTSYVFYTVKERSYFWFGLYILAYILFQLSMTGFGHKFLWPDYAWFTQYPLLIFANVSILLVGQFVKVFLKTRTRLPIWNKVLTGIQCVFALLLVWSLFGANGLLATIMNYLTLMAAVVILVVSAILAKRGNRYAKYFVMAWGLFLCSIALFTLNNLGVIPYVPILYHSIKVGSLVKILILTLVLTNRINLLVKEKREIVISQNIMLEQKVNERTAGLREQNAIIKTQMEEKEIMLKEIHHRVKNNLQIVNSLLRLQSYGMEGEMAQEAFEDAQKRILAMALVHDKLYNSENLAKINVQQYALELAKDLIANYQLEQKIELRTDIQNIALGAKTMVPVGLLINEVITNSLKYGFGEMEKGEVFIEMNESKGEYHLIIGDNGKGIEAADKGSGIGMELIDAFVEQLEGTLEVKSNPGVIYSLKFKPLETEREQSEDLVG